MWSCGLIRDTLHPMNQRQTVSQPQYAGAQKTIAVIIALFIIGTALLTRYVLQLESELVQTFALNEAARYSRTLEEFRTLYTAEVVERARAEGVMVTHDYLDHKGAIPLPATLSMLLGNRLNVRSAGRVHLYSDYPFPWRVKEGGPRDQFEREALAALRTNPDKPYVRYESKADDSFVRYATADRMRTSCVNCHNTHPQSPKRDWEEGDVRGVLSVSVLLDEDSEQARKGLRAMLSLLTGSAALGLILLAYVAVRLRKSAIVSGYLAATTQRANQSLEQEIEHRERAEAERRQMEAQVRHTQKLETIGVLAGGIAHDFNNLIHGMQGHATLAKLHLPDGSPGHENIDNVAMAAERAAELTEQLLRYAGKSPVKKTQFDLSALIAELKPLLITANAGRGTLTFDLATNLPTIQADSAQIQQMVTNLLTNAADAMHADDGTIVIRTGLWPPRTTGSTQSPNTSHVFLAVVDSGVGMDDETQQKMFDPFFTTRREGRGLGLATLQGTVHAHGGEIHVTSELKKGTAIRVLLPTVVHSQIKHTLDKPIRVNNASANTVLVIDDDTIVRDVACQLLEKCGYTILESSNGAAGVDVFEQHANQVFAVLLDMNMPGLSGEDTYLRLTEIDPNVKVIISSGFTGDDTVQRILQNPQVALLKKPYTQKELVDVLSCITTTTLTEPKPLNS